MSEPKTISKKKSGTSPPSVPSQKEVNLVRGWWNRKQEVNNGLIIEIQNNKGKMVQIKFGLQNKSSADLGYDCLLYAKIFEIFGVNNPNVAGAAFGECINCVIDNTALNIMGEEERKDFIEAKCKIILSLFQEMRPRDVMELMMVSKLIVLDNLSNREFLGSVTVQSENTRAERQHRGIKLSRLFMDFKEKLDKHRMPQQQIHVQHNHIHNEGQAIIGSQISTGGGR